MTAFEIIATALSFVSGLAVAIILTSGVRAFLLRRRTELDWVPFAWAFCLLLIQFQTWWTHIALRSVEAWTFGTYWLLLLQTATLFVASALVLPSDATDYPSSLRQYFEHDGKWSVAAVAVQIVVAVTINVAIFSRRVTEPFHLFHVILLTACVLLLTTSRRSVQIAATVVFTVLTIGAMVATALDPELGQAVG